MTSCNSHSVQSKSVCDSLWFLFLGEDEYAEDETVNDTVAGHSHLIESPNKRSKPKLVSKDDDSSDDDKVMTYFIGAGDGGGDRTKKTFRRRRKKLQCSQSSLPDENERDAPNMIWVEKPMCEDESTRSAELIMPPQCASGNKVDKYTILEAREEAEDSTILNSDSDGTLTAPALYTTGEKRENSEQEQWWKSGWRGLRARKDTSQPVKYAISDDPGFKEALVNTSMETKEDGETAKDIEAVSKTRRGTNNEQLKAPSSPPTSSDYAHSSDDAAKPGISSMGRRKGDGREKKPTKPASGLHVESVIPSVGSDSGMKRHSHGVGKEKKYLGSVASDAGSLLAPAGDLGSRTYTNRIGSDRKKLPSVTNDGGSGRHRQEGILMASSMGDERPHRLSSSGTRVFAGKGELNSSSSQKGDIRAKRYHQYERPSRAQDENSHMSRRELELRSIGGIEHTRWASAPRPVGWGYEESDNNRYPRSSARDLESSRDQNRATNGSSRQSLYRDTRDVPRQHKAMCYKLGRSSRSESQVMGSRRSELSSNGKYKFIDLSSDDDETIEHERADNSNPALPASLKLEIGARVARKQSEKVAQWKSDSPLRSRRNSSVPKQRHFLQSDSPGLLMAGSLKL